MSSLLFVLSALIAALEPSSAPTVERYDITARLDLARGAIAAEAVLTLLAPDEGFEKITLQLNRGFELQAVTAEEEIARFSFDKTRVGEYRYSSVGAVLDVEFARPVRAGRRVKLKVVYAGELAAAPRGFNLISAERTEIALYCAWFPHHPESRNFLFDIDLATDPDYLIASNGLVTGGNGEWHIHNGIETSDIVLFTAAGLQRKLANVGGLELRFYYTAVPEAVIDSLGDAGRATLADYTQWFGGSHSQGISIVFPERDWGGGYARPGFVVMQYSHFAQSGEVDYPLLVRGLAHEAAHIWWKDASVTTWEDWLNESFAEYSALMVVRELYGEEYYAEQIAGYIAESEGTPPIWGINRGDEQAYTALYVKGPVILSRLEAAIGRQQFLEFLGALQRERVQTTAALLDVLARTVSEAARMQLETDLKR